MPLLQIFIINRNGGVVFNKSFLSGKAPSQSINDVLRIGATFHSLSEIVKQFAPTESGGMEKIETSTFKLQCFQTLTGVKFVVTATLDSPDLEPWCQKVYEIYSNYALKNPFYEMEQPINCDLFNSQLEIQARSFR